MLEEIFLEIIGLTELPENFETLGMGDIETWDSLANFNLLLALEDHLGVRFSVDEISTLTSIKALRTRLNL